MCLLLTAPAFGWGQEKILVGGAAGPIPVMQELAEAYQSKNPPHRIEIMPNSLGSTGAIQATEAGRVMIGLTVRDLRQEEKARLIRRVIGRMPVVIGVHAQVSVNSLSESQICEIFAGKSRSWKEVGGSDSRIVVLTRNEDDSNKEAVRRQLPCFKGLAESPEAIVLTKAKQMDDTLASRPFTIGLTDFGGVVKAQGRLKAVAIDGVAPSVDSLRNEKYRLFKEFGVVTLGEPQGLTKRFLNFVVGPEGERILHQNGVVVLQ